jgi:hypothetical protein
MWNYKLVFTHSETGEEKIIKGRGYNNPELAKEMLSIWLRRNLPGMRLYRIIDAYVDYVPEKAFNEES